jgi:hypothetical protein
MRNNLIALDNRIVIRSRFPALGSNLLNHDICGSFVCAASGLGATEIVDEDRGAAFG